jgi:hypothetical protein
MTSGAAARVSTLPLRTALPKPATRKATPLRLVPQRRSSAARAPFVVVVVALLASGLLGLLLLNTLVAQGSFALHDLSAQGRALQQQEQELARQVEGLQAPSVLAARATALGMVPGSSPAFLRLPDGTVLGIAAPGAAAPQPAAKPAAPAVRTTKPVTKPVTKPGATSVTKPVARTAGTPAAAAVTSHPVAGLTTTGAHR